MQLIKKIAFLVHEPTMYAHYANVWAEMPSSQYTIVLIDRSKFEGEKAVHGAGDFMRHIEKYDYCYFDDLITKKIKYKYVVSNHIMGGSGVRPAGRWQRNKAHIKNAIKRVVNPVLKITRVRNTYEDSRIDAVQYLPLQIGQYQVRFVYGADIGDGWSLQDWNEIYDLFLCHGPNDEEQLRKKFKGKTAIMGYPRYDDYFSESLDIQSVVEEFDLDPNKKTLLWMSTLGQGASSIPRYAAAIAGLRSDYNIIARPHPLAFRQEPENIELLRSLNLNIDGDVTRDMNRLYKAVDWVFCDYGGSPFGALYLGINLLLLDVPGSENQFTVANSSNQEIREHFPVVSQPNGEELFRLLRDDAVWREQEKVRTRLCRKYFADLKGSSSRTAVQILSNLDKIIAV
jgi:hypothetical protein